MEQVLSICSNDPELNNLLKDHPLLIKSLESIHSLSSEHIFSILTAVENEVILIQAYMLTKEIQQIKDAPDSKSFTDSMALEIEELKSMLVREQEYNESLNSVNPI